ncbi:mRNA triphosphatase CET1 [Jaminaea rosea]|uniref:mRNA-capping enzyme subunit beta n=1 Tax=Jaminaea rosea TaxID=1569628 RepID=A0A316UQ21_9BASI|nr:mRNA triphosphatase CET1 [Jaminaea rosea]PWN25973.1 mRNA triphosphatase CET1 [Jaminaea rosea]
MASSSQPSASSAPPQGDVPRSIFGTDPLDDFLLSISSWIYHTSQGGHLLGPDVDGEIEIEAKLGTLIDTRTNQRIVHPVAHDVVLSNPSNTRFVSGMSQEAHRHFNGLLNGLCQPAQGRPRVQYKRHNEIDYFHGTGRGERLRVTKEAESLRTKPRGCIVKHRLGNLEVHCPGRHFDFRISVNLEVQATEPGPDQSTDFYREKNRLSYTHEGGMRIDLTQVTVPPSGSGEATLQHELEVELSTPPNCNWGGEETTLNGEKGGHDWTEYEDMVARFVNDVRLLIRNAQGR